MLTLSKIKLWWHLSKIQTSTPQLEILFWLVQNKRSLHDIELFTIWVGLSVICLYPADNVTESISWPAKLVISFCHHLEQRALKSPVTVVHQENSWLVLLRSKSNFEKKLSNSDLGNDKYRLKTFFTLQTNFSH